MKLSGDILDTALYICTSGHYDCVDNIVDLYLLSSVPLATLNVLCQNCKVNITMVPVELYKYGIASCLGACS